MASNESRTPSLTVALLIISDTASQDASTDKSTPALRSVFDSSEPGNWQVAETAIVPDETDQIQEYIKIWADEKKINCIITSGGTGFAVKDKTPEAVEPLIHRHAPGLVHAMLSSSLAITPFAMMARPVAGTRNQSLIITLPGSPKGAKENLEAIIRFLPHACNQAAGGDSRAMHAGGVKKLEKDAGLTSSTITKEPSASNTQSHSHSHHHPHHHNHGTGHKIPKPHTRPDERPLNPISNDPSAGPVHRKRKSPYPMLSVVDALREIKNHTLEPRVVTLSVDGAVGHVLAEDVHAKESVPAFRASIVDGYAIKIPGSGTFQKGVYPVALVSTAHAGEIPELKEGTIARITTGAPLPNGADAVVMVEDTVIKTTTDDGKEEKEVEILTSEVQKGENVREIGSDIKTGDLVLKASDGISAIGGEFGMLASAGVQEVKVYQKPVIGVLSTGDELVHHSNGKELSFGEVRDTNLPTLLKAIESTGFKAVDLGRVSDKTGDLESSIRSALTKDSTSGLAPTFLITTGGVSMGELDLLKPTIERALGGTIHFGRVSMKPGKPTTFATVSLKNPSSGIREPRVIFGLPGNPASAIVTYFLFVLPALHLSSGIKPIGLPMVKAILEQDVRPDAVRPEYHRVSVVVRADGRLYAISTGGQRSSRIGSFKGANGLLALPATDQVQKKGTVLDVLLMGNILSDL